jgi:2,4-dichlorophenol 6-monooxygenase
MGFVPGNGEVNTALVIRLFEDTQWAETQRAQIQRAIELHDIELSAHDIELGYFYESSAVVGDGSWNPKSDPTGRTYVPTTRPGHRLPHVWLETDGKVFSTHDLVGAGEADFLLITDEYGEAWVKAAEEVNKTARKYIAVAQVASQRRVRNPKFFEDYDGQWVLRREVGNGGAVLVRPDNMVAWRSQQTSKSGGKELVDAIGKIVGRSNQQVI